MENFGKGPAIVIGRIFRRLSLHKSSMQNEARLFGIDLAPLWRDMLTAWSAMLEWPVISWLWPRPRICLWLSPDRPALSRGPASALEFDNPMAERARFKAVQLPEELILRRNFGLPRLAQAELEFAVNLQLENLSPFVQDDAVWAFYTLPTLDGESLQVHAIVSTRKLIAQHMAMSYPQLDSDKLEVWVSVSDQPHHLLLPGFAEHLRQSRSALWRWASAFLVLLSLSIGAAMAITPTVQLYLKAKHADAAIKLLQEKALPVIEERQVFAKATEKLSNLNELAGKAASPLQVLDLITNALSDETSLLSLQIQGNKASISGQTANAASLMKQLSTTPGLKEVRAPTPATKPLGAVKESFTIEFVIDPAQLVSPAVAQNVAPIGQAVQVPVPAAPAASPPLAPAALPSSVLPQVSAPLLKAAPLVTPVPAPSAPQVNPMTVPVPVNPMTVPVPPKKTQ